MTVGGLAASTTYIGVPSRPVGVLQINFTIPTNAGTGTLPVVVSVSGLASKAADLAGAEIDCRKRRQMPR